MRGGRTKRRRTTTALHARSHQRAPNPRLCLRTDARQIACPIGSARRHKASSTPACASLSVCCTALAKLQSTSTIALSLLSSRPPSSPRMLDRQLSAGACCLPLGADLEARRSPATYVRPPICSACALQYARAVPRLALSDPHLVLDRRMDAGAVTACVYRGRAPSGCVRQAARKGASNWRGHFPRGDAATAHHAPRRRALHSHHTGFLPAWAPICLSAGSATSSVGTSGCELTAAWTPLAGVCLRCGHVGKYLPKASTEAVCVSPPTPG